MCPPNVESWIRQCVRVRVAYTPMRLVFCRFATRYDINISQLPN